MKSGDAGGTEPNIKVNSKDEAVAEASVRVARHPSRSKSPTVAFVHDYLHQYGGAEKTFEAMLELFPTAPVFTGIYNPKNLPESITKRDVICPTSRAFARMAKFFTFLMPLIFESMDLRDFDLVISDGTAWPKGVITNPRQLHISYVHTPPRFLYKYSVESTKRSKWYFKPVVAIMDHFLRGWDFTAAQRPDFLLTNSRETQGRIKKFYGRDAQILYPPVDVDVKDYNSKAGTNNGLKKPYYLALGRLAAYKNFDFLVEAFNLLGFPLVIAGTGAEEKRLKKKASENITFTGMVSEKEKHALLEGCLGLISPVQDEDFGIVPLEALAHGKPVLAHRSGGHLETIREGVDGMFFEEIDIEKFIKGMKTFDELVRADAFNPSKMKVHVKKFAKTRFQNEFMAYVKGRWKEHAGAAGSTYNSNRS